MTTAPSFATGRTLSTVPPQAAPPSAPQAAPQASSPAAPPAPPDGPPHAAVAARMNTLMHAMGRFRHQMQLARRGGEGEAAYNMILFFLVSTGPARAGVLAEHLNADPSTVSRQVAALVKDGLLERQADPEDGRATLLAPTDLGRERFAHHVQRRDDHYGQMLTEWEPDDLADFARLLARFTDDFDNYKHQILADIAADPGRSPGAPTPEPTSREEN